MESILIVRAPRPTIRRVPIAPPLLRWFRRVARDLPWRRTRDPYAVWVSEVMLQQTQITTVLPYYDRWMKRFPDVRALARARLDRVLKAWEGLGYYARARHLHRAARLLERGRFPTTKEAWETLPGIGPYTAAAIASIANGERVPVRDGNVHRVVARLLRIEAPISSSAAQREINAFLEREIPARVPGDFNQALMELGQRVCLPRSPRCGECPVTTLCRGRIAGVQEDLPRRVPRKTVPHYEVGVGICWKGDRVLVARRPERGLLGGLWEFPGGKRRPSETYARTVTREFREEVGMEIEVGPRLVTVPHRYSHFSVELHAYHCRWRKGSARALANDGVRWVRPRDLARLAFPTANRKIIEALLRPRSLPSPDKTQRRQSATR
ncbi:MAG: A/G-specific adenine glycosylase [Planctomycetes bacterium]|nr:A/G-specific adenine glycosylase [Planctomycetota bacterium]